MAQPNALHIHPIPQLSAVIATCIALLGCAPSRDLVPVADWCWLHYRLAPPGALAFDVGPNSVAEAATWDTWLGSTADAPADRHGPHQTQRELIDRFTESGGWSNGARELYRSSAHNEPTPATICETVGARIAVAHDGSLPSGWDERFLDPNDPAYSGLANDAGLAR